MHFDEFIFKFRFLIGGILIFVILSGIGVIIYEKSGNKNKNTESEEVATLKEQNDLLRQQLSAGSTQTIAGASTEQAQGDKNTRPDPLRSL